MSSAKTIADSAPPNQLEQPPATLSKRVDFPHGKPGIDTADSSSVEGGSQRIEVDAAGEHQWPDFEDSLESLQVEQIRLQAQQLAGHLRTKQSELDRRESETMARVSQLENDERAARLWLRERLQEFNMRQAELAEQQQELEELQADLERRSRELDQQALSLQSSQQEREQTRQAESEELAAELSRLKELQDLLNRHLSQLDDDREELVQQQQQFESKARNDRQSLLERQQRSEAEIARIRERLQEREAQLDKREEAVKALQDEVSVVHRETLEVRLVAEQIWSQLATTAPPAELTQSLSQIRRRLADEYRLESTAVATQRDELEQLADRLDSRQQQIKQQRSELQSWFERRNQEIEEQAARLVAREQELDLQEHDFAEQRDQWAGERRRLQAEIRSLTEQLRPTKSLAA